MAEFESQLNNIEALATKISKMEAHRNQIISENHSIMQETLQNALKREGQTHSEENFEEKIKELKEMRDKVVNNEKV